MKYTLKLSSLLLIIFMLSSTVCTAQDSTDDKTFQKVEEEAQYPGGVKAWMALISENMNAQVPVDNDAPAGTYMVIVKFIVDKSGVVRDVVAETNFGYGMEREAIRVIKLSGKWKPAIQNGRPVNAYRRQPIGFVVPKARKKKRASD